MASNFDRYVTLKESNAFSGAHVVDSINDLPARFIPDSQSNLYAAAVPMPAAAQNYYDRLDLAAVARHAPDRMVMGVEEKISIFAFNSTQMHEARGIIARNLPEGTGRDDLITFWVDVIAEKQRQMLGGAATYGWTINLEGSHGVFHVDPTSRSLYQNNKSNDPADTTLVAAPDIAKQRKNGNDGKPVNHYGTLEETAPQLVRTIAPNSLTIWAGADSPWPLFHVEPSIPKGGKVRSTLIANP